MTARQLALRVLLRCEKSGGYSPIVLDTMLSRSELELKDRALVTALVTSVISHKITLDYLIGRLSSIPEEKIEDETRNILRLGLSQIIYFDRIPAHAAVNESVILAPHRSAGFVNAVLRSYLRQKDVIPFPENAEERLSVLYSVDRILVRELVGSYGYDKTESILRAFSEPPYLSIRVNTLKTDRESLISRLGKGAKASELSLCGIRLEGGSVTSLPGFDEGEFFVQDTASQLCTAALGGESLSGGLFIDSCAAPGSKSFGVAIDMQNRGRVLSFDLHENKLSLISESAARLGIDIIETKKADGREFISELSGVADAVLCDVPCSGYGVLAKKPEIRYKSPEVCAALPDIQYAILENCSRYVKKGGVLVYSTCTLLPRENEENARRFLSDHGDLFVPEAFRVNGRTYPAFTTLFPDTEGTDGFFIAKFRRK